MEPASDWVIRQLQFASRVGTWLAAAISVAALVIWAFDFPALVGIKPVLVSMSTPVTTCFLLSAFAIHGLTATEPAFLRNPILLRACTALVTLISIVVLALYLSGLHSNDYILLHSIGRVSPATAINFIFLALATHFIDRGNGIISATLAAIGLVIVEFDLVGHAYGIDVLNRISPFNNMALPTGLSFLILFVALLLARPYQGWIQYASRGGRVGMVFRPLLPAVVIVPFVLTYIASRLAESAAVDTPFAFALLTVATSVVLAALVCLSSARLLRFDEAFQQAEAELRKNVQLMEAATGIARLGAWVSDIISAENPNARVEWSSETYRIYGVDKETFDHSPATFFKLVHPEDRNEVIANVRKGIEENQSSLMAFRIVWPDGTVRWVQQQSQVMQGPGNERKRVVGVVQDVTQTRMIEQQLVQAQKMEAIGNLTGGMAHDFNNLLGIIIGNLDMLPPYLKDNPQAREMVQDALEAALRGADLTRRLLAFARRQPLQPLRVDPNELICSIVTLLRRTLGEAIDISLDLAANVSQVLVDPAQLQASITNLANNARDAMPKGGKLMIATANRHLDAEYAATHAEVIPGDYVMIEVSDTGQGMSSEVMAHVFEPFYTTKEQGKGTGLGLSMVFGFMKQSNGHVNVYSEPGVGTTFRLYLPCTDVTKDLPSGNAASATELSGGSETVLVVEDNDAMRQVAIRQLTELGYRVLEADSGAAARKLLATKKIDILFTDIVMPGGIDGLDLAHQAATEYPSLKIVLTSGFPEARLNGHGNGIGNMQLLSKPYRRDDLARILRMVLDS